MLAKIVFSFQLQTEDYELHTFIVISTSGNNRKFRLIYLGAYGLLSICRAKESNEMEGIMRVSNNNNTVTTKHATATDGERVDNY